MACVFLQVRDIFQGRVTWEGMESGIAALLKATVPSNPRILTGSWSGIRQILDEGRSIVVLVLH